MMFDYASSIKSHVFGKTQHKLGAGPAEPLRAGYRASLTMYQRVIWYIRVRLSVIECVHIKLCTGSQINSCEFNFYIECYELI